MDKLNVEKLLVVIKASGYGYVIEPFPECIGNEAILYTVSWS